LRFQLLLPTLDKVSLVIMQFYTGIIAISKQLIHFILTSQRHHYFYTIHRLVLSFLIVAFVEPSMLLD
ncbi:hypothetical protein T4B_12460, partial [Trichinella pseudospiralis]